MSLHVRVTDSAGAEVLDIRIDNRGPTDMTTTPGWEDDRHYRWVAFAGADHAFAAQGELDHRRSKGAVPLLHSVLEDLDAELNRRPVRS